jgi:hypothetical protein
MKPVEFKNAYYIKLGRKGQWENSSIQEGKISFGWKEAAPEDINNGNWQMIKKAIKKEIKDQGAAERDYKALRNIVDSTPDDVWVTFHSSSLWWCRVSKAGVLEDQHSKYRRTLGQWHSCDINDHQLIINEIPGALSRLQGFRGTVCRVKETDSLRRLLNNHPSPAYLAITAAANHLAAELEPGIRLLHWKDFETLVDLLFRGAGWRRVSTLGETMKFSDLELEEPVTGGRYQVQVKSSATVADFQEYAENFASTGFRKLYFVVHSPVGDWSGYPIPENVELIRPDKLAQMVIKFGLISWLVKKLK